MSKMRPAVNVSTHDSACASVIRVACSMAVTFVQVHVCRSLSTSWMLSDMHPVLLGYAGPIIRVHRAFRVWPAQV